ncbi:MAG TPA: M28 family peptidase [Solirubrobacteraceae bacterium]
MEAIDIVRGLAGFMGRGAGTDAERRAALWLADQLTADGQEATVETFWCRPNWALTHALHAALAVAGSLASLASPIAGVALLALALASVVGDWLSGHSPGRALTRQHASQNLLLAPAQDQPNEQGSVRLILTANYDAGRAGIAYRDSIRRPAGALRQTAKGFTPGWLGWLSIGIAWLLAVAILRLAGHTSHAVGLLQLPPTAGLLLGAAILLELAIASWSPAAGDNATGVAVAVALARALGTTPLQHVRVELLLTGAGDGDQAGLRRHLRARRRARRAADTVVLGLAACGAGTPHWWVSDGQLIPLRYDRSLRELAQEIASDEPHLRAHPFKGRGCAPALPGRIAGIPAITLGCLDSTGLAPRSHQQTDTIQAVDSAALDAALQFALLMVDAIDTAVGELRERRATTPA